MRRLIVTTLFLLAIAASAMAVQPDEILKDPVLEGRARALSAGLRCLVCQNQSIDDSDAALARDIRLVVREHIQAGESDDDGDENEHDREHAGHAGGMQPANRGLNQKSDRRPQNEGAEKVPE